MIDALALNTRAHKGNVPQVKISTTGLALSVGFDGFYRVWDISTQEKLFEIRVPGLTDPPSGFFTADGEQLAYEDALGNIRFAPLDIEEVIARAQAALTRTLTDDEFTQCLHTDGCGEWCLRI